MIRAAWPLPIAAATANNPVRLRRKRLSRMACWQDCKRSFKSGFTALTAGWLAPPRRENSLDGSGDLALETIHALRNRRIPVHAVGFSKEQLAHDLELSDVRVASRAMADSRIPATVTFHQRGYAGNKALLVIRDGDKTL